ncbi:MAG TPA: 50S ribosomal protein L30 [Acidimicrobiales bacterium]|nr:50S ribosomal protein L30 [Acidimicrobiales bacterium]
MTTNRHTREQLSTDLVVTQVRSGISQKPKHRATLRALGLGRIGQSNALPDRPEIRGMIARVPHLVTVEVRGDLAEGNDKDGSK